MTISTRQNWKTEESCIFTYDLTTSTNSFFGHFLLFKSRIICLFVFFLLYRASSQNTLFKYNFFLGYFWGRTFTSNTLAQQLLFIYFYIYFFVSPQFKFMLHNSSYCYKILSYPIYSKRLFLTLFFTLHGKNNITTKINIYLTKPWRQKLVFINVMFTLKHSSNKSIPN